MSLCPTNRVCIFSRNDRDVAALCDLQFHRTASHVPRPGFNRGLVIPQPAEGQHAGWISLEDGFCQNKKFR